MPPKKLITITKKEAPKAEKTKQKEDDIVIENTVIDEAEGVKEPKKLDKIIDKLETLEIESEPVADEKPVEKKPIEKKVVEKKKKEVDTEPSKPNLGSKGDTDEVLVDIGKVSTHVSSKNKKSGSKKTDPHQAGENFDDDNVDYRHIMLNYDFTKNKTRPMITKYEKALLVGKRAKQIESGSNPNVKVLPGQSAIDVAEEELRQRKIPLIIKRPIGNSFEYWKPVDMEVDLD